MQMHMPILISEEENMPSFKKTADKAGDTSYDVTSKFKTTVALSK